MAESAGSGAIAELGWPHDRPVEVGLRDEPFFRFVIRHFMAQHERRDDAAEQRPQLPAAVAVRLTPDILGSHPVSLVYRREIGDEALVRAVIRFVAAVVRDNAALIGGEPRLPKASPGTTPVGLAE